MKTKPIPAIVMLVAGLVVCIAGMAGHMETGRFVKMLLVVLIVFYIIGGIVKLLIDKNFKDMEEETTDGEETPDAEVLQQIPLLRQRQKRKKSQSRRAMSRMRNN